MLRIRKKQLAVFQPVADAAFVRQTVEYLRENHADVVVRLSNGASVVEEIPDETLHDMVQNGIVRARRYDISWESTLTAFVVLMFVTAPNFDEHPLISEVLRDEMAPPDSRIDQLWEQTSEQDWEAVIQNYDASAWKLKKDNG